MQTGSWRRFRHQHQSTTNEGGRRAVDGGGCRAERRQKALIKHVQLSLQTTASFIWRHLALQIVTCYAYCGLDESSETGSTEHSI